MPMARNQNHTATEMGVGGRRRWYLRSTFTYEIDEFLLLLLCFVSKQTIAMISDQKPEKNQEPLDHP